MKNDRLLKVFNSLTFPAFKEMGFDEYFKWLDSQKQKWSDLHLNAGNEEFEKTMNSLVKECGIEEIVETGTCFGTGSTTILAKIGIPIHTIEVDLRRHEIAKGILADYPNVNLIHAYSLNKDNLVKFVKEKRKHWETKNGKDWAERHTESMLNELCEPKDRENQRPKQENLLVELISNTKKQIIFLDSAGAVGFLEFMAVVSIDPVFLSKKIIYMDDANCEKHKNSVQWLEDNGYEYTYVHGKRQCYAKMQ
jgi:hypothetical protein